MESGQRIGEDLRWRIVLLGIIVLGMTFPHIPSMATSEISYIVPPPFSDPFDFTTYHSYNETVNLLQTVSSTYPDITKLVSLGVTFEGRDIWAMKVSDNPDVEENEPEVYFSACHHAREWMTTEVCLYTLTFLVDNYSTNSTVKDLVDNRQMWFVPVVNPDGRVYDSPGDDPSNHSYQPFGWRKNRIDNGDGTYGVDLNRNYGYMWGGVGASHVTESFIHRGPEPFSENETRAIRDFVERHDFVFAINYHSYSQLILYPWGYTLNDSADQTLFHRVASGISERITNKAGSAYPGYIPQKGSELYYLSGIADDWFYGVHGTYSFCVEVYPSWNDYYEQWDPAVSPPFDVFHPRSDKIIPACQDNLDGALYLVEMADNPFQVLDDRVTLNPLTKSLTINRTDSGSLNLTVINNGNVQRTFGVTAITDSHGLAIDIYPSSITLSPGGSGNVTVEITAGPSAPSGSHHVHIQAATGDENFDHARGETTITLRVPCQTDAGADSIDSHVNRGTYPLGDHVIISTISNHGSENQTAFNVSMEVLRRGPLISRTLFVDNGESSDGPWHTVDLDGPLSPDTWQVRQNTGRGGSGAWWCGSGDQYSPHTTQLLLSPSIDLSEVAEANLTFYHMYTTQILSGFCAVDLFDGFGWSTRASFDGYGPVNYTRISLNLTEYAGCNDFRFRFRFNSDDQGQMGNGWFIDDVLLTAKTYAETTVHGPDMAQTAGVMQQGDSQQLDWNCTFTAPGEYVIRITTLLQNDECALNDVCDITITIEATLNALNIRETSISRPSNHHNPRTLTFLHTQVRIAAPGAASEHEG